MLDRGINLDYEPCRTVSGSERMLRSMRKESVRPGLTLNPCIRSLPLAVLHCLHSKLNPRVIRKTAPPILHFFITSREAWDWEVPFQWTPALGKGPTGPLKPLAWRPFSLAMPQQTIYHDAVGTRSYWFVLSPAVILFLLMIW